jgi:hypothetical protein
MIITSSIWGRGAFIDVVPSQHPHYLQFSVDRVKGEEDELERRGGEKAPAADERERAPAADERERAPAADERESPCS